MDYSNGSLIKALNTIESNLTTYESRQMKYKGATDCAT